MSSGGSVTHWIRAVREGDEAAAQQLWERYYERLVRLARRKLRGAPRRAADEEDVALVAFNSFCTGARVGRFPLLRDRHDLWQLLVTITCRRAQNQARDEFRQKRGAGRVQVFSGRKSDRSSDPQFEMDEVLGHEPTPAFAALVAEECERLLDQLESQTLRSIAVWKMEGYDNKEIARRFGCAPRTIERKLKLIRQKWSHEVPT